MNLISKIPPMENSKQNLCQSFASLDGNNTRYIFTKYLSDKEIKQISEFSFAKINREFYYSNQYRNYHTIKQALPNDFESKFINDIANRLYKDIKECSKDGVAMGAYYTGLRSDYDTWHQDLTSLEGRGEPFKGIEYSAMLYIKGDTTEFIRYDAKIYNTSIVDSVVSGHLHNFDESCAQIEKPHIGDVAILLDGREFGAIHRAPVYHGEDRLFIAYEGVFLDDLITIGEGVTFTV